MTSTVLLLCLTAIAASAQEPLPEAIPNWSAPASWTPPSHPKAGDLTGDKAGSAAPLASPLPFIPVSPCRIVDTRLPAGSFGGPALAASQPRNFLLHAGPCSGIPAFAAAYSLNITATNTQGTGFLSMYPQDQPPQPLVSTLNYVGGESVANAAIVPAGMGGGVTALAGVSGADLIIDINGYYAGGPRGSSNTFVGRNAGNSTMTGDFNTGVGARALEHSTGGSFNVAVGYVALIGNTTGVENTALGSFAMNLNETGSSNTAVGRSALVNNRGDSNTAVGRNALFSNNTGVNNAALGRDAGSSILGSNNICIANTGTSADAATIRIGEPAIQVATFIAGISGALSPGGIGVLVNSSGKLGVPASSRRVKTDIHEIAGESDGLMRLRPVAFEYKPEIDPTGLVQYGLIAEEVAEVYPDLVTYGRDGQPEAVRYHLINVLLLNEIQKQRRAIEQQNDVIERLTTRLEILEARAVERAAR